MKKIIKGFILISSVALCTVVFSVEDVGEIATRWVGWIPILKLLGSGLIGLTGVVMLFFGIKKTFASAQQKQQQQGASGGILLAGAFVALTAFAFVETARQSTFGTTDTAKYNETNF